MNKSGVIVYNYKIYWQTIKQGKSVIN